MLISTSCLGVPIGLEPLHELDVVEGPGFDQPSDVNGLFDSNSSESALQGLVVVDRVVLGSGVEVHFREVDRARVEGVHELAGDGAGGRLRGRKGKGGESFWFGKGKRSGLRLRARREEEKSKKRSKKKKKRKRK